MNEDIEKILLAGSKAPSGSNSQPWKFRVKDDLIETIATPEKDHPILNFRNRGTWVAHGALIENILIACNHFGYEANLKIFPDKSQPNLTSRISLKKTSPKEEPLYNNIFKRSTNRKLYNSIPLSSNDINDLQESFDKLGTTKELKFINDSAKLKSLSSALTIAEIVNLEDKNLHKLFFEEIVWTEKEENSKKTGLYLKTMELPKPAIFIMRILKYWPFMWLANLFLAARIISKNNQRWYSNTATLGAILVEDKDEDFITAGRLLERLWLTATKLGLSFHITSGSLFLAQRVFNSKTDIFSPKHSLLIKKSYENIAKQFNAPPKIVGLVFRIGHSPPPSALSSKRMPAIIKF